MPLEIIDLTSPSPTAETLDPNNEPVTTTSLNDVSEEPRKKRKRKPKRSTTNSSLAATAPQSLRNSLEREIELLPPRKRKRTDHSPDPDTRSSADKGDNAETHDLFFVDLAPTPIPSARQTTVEKSSESQETTGKLLVPSHVTVLGSTPVEIIAQPLSDSDDDDFIDYLDYEDAKRTLRYYDDLPSDTINFNRTICKNCGAEGEHKTSACPVQICLTCGVRDEHSTRSCPISKVCFTCGMKGHINANCPNRRSARALMATQESECDRCSSSRHKTNECPTLWRLYKYFSPEEQARTISLRQSKKDFKLGQGGEGYVADNEWCYNCGSYGHWGDDCHDLVQRQLFPEEFSAFSKFNMMNGPFYDPAKELKSSTGRSYTRNWEQADSAPGRGKAAPSNVGRQARIKSRATMARQAQQAEDDPDDWFRNSAKRNRPSSASRTNESKKLMFGKSFGEARSFAPPSNGPPSLMARIGDYCEDSRPKRPKRDRDHSARRGRSTDRYIDRPQHVDSGPRYRGGYSR